MSLADDTQYVVALHQANVDKARLRDENKRLRGALLGLLAAYTAEFGDPLQHTGPVTDAAKIARAALQG